MIGKIMKPFRLRFLNTTQSFHQGIVGFYPIFTTTLSPQTGRPGGVWGGTNIKRMARLSNGIAFIMNQASSFKLELRCKLSTLSSFIEHISDGSFTTDLDVRDY